MNLDQASKEYQRRMYGYTVKEDIIKTDCSNQQNIIDIDDAFKAGSKWRMEQLLIKARKWLEENVTNYEAFDPINRTYYQDINWLIADFEKAMKD